MLQADVVIMSARGLIIKRLRTFFCSNVGRKHNVRPRSKVWVAHASSDVELGKSPSSYHIFEQQLHTSILQLYSELFSHALAKIEKQ